MLTRFVRIQLLIFTIIGIVGVIAMALFYVQAPTLLGIGRMTVTLELPATGGLYRFSNVTYRGVQVGKVTAVSLTAKGAKATLSLGTSPKIPANLQADVQSVSAVGEQGHVVPSAHAIHQRVGGVVLRRGATSRAPPLVAAGTSAVGTHRKRRP